MYRGFLFDDFEGSVPNPAMWATISNGFQLTACTPPSGNGLWFNGNGIRQAITNPLNVTGGGFIEFWIRIGMKIWQSCRTELQL